MFRLLLLALFLSAPLGAMAEEEAPARAIEAWLVLPAVDVLAPALGGEDADGIAGLGLPVARLHPEAGAGLAWPGQEQILRWSRLEAADGEVDVGEAADHARARLLALHLDATTFVEGKLRLQSGHALTVWLDGAEIGAKKSDADDAEEVGAVESDLELEPGRHILIVLASTVAGPEAAWSLSASVRSEHLDALEWGTDAQHRLRLADVLDAKSLGGLALSGDGEVLAMTFREPAATREDSRSWVEFVDPENGDVLRTLEGVGMLSSFQWSREQSYSYVTRNDGKATLWVADFDGGAARAVLRDVEHFGGYRWLPDGSGVVFSVTEEGKKDPDGFKRYRGLADRWSGARDRSHLHEVDASGGATRRLTGGALGVQLQDISPDGRHLLISRERRHDDEWPFVTAELLELDRRTLETRSLAEEVWGLAGLYSPDGKTIAVTSHADAFDGIGRAVGEDVQINLYEGQVYLLDRASGAARAISRDFDPAVESVTWSTHDGRLYARTTDGERAALYRFDVRRDTWEKLDAVVEVTRRLTMAAEAPVIAWAGTSVNDPTRVFSASTKGRWEPRALGRIDAERYAQVRFGGVEEWNWQEGGLLGRVYLPPDFDATRKYPVIVYYYGGTVPVTRDFGGRYPKELWAAHGYVVYVMQPSGATGFGQEFAARHVNNWGVTVADEIIGATREFLATHEYADPEKVGCIGASYGGFMTMLLTTRTDLFTAAVSHAGISAIGSYWGEGNWGFSYSAAATSESYPWNRPDLYVDQSPLFSADRIHTPLLLLHGADDDNVPPGESEQLYTALRVLGREVEYIRIDGERHWILSYDKRARWSKSIVAWFDRYLKEDAAWWDQLWPADAD